LPNKKLALNWVKHVASTEERDEFYKYVMNCRPLLERLKTIVDEKIEAQSKVKTTDYDCPSWSHKQADTNGYLRALKEIQTLTKHIEG